MKIWAKSSQKYCLLAYILTEIESITSDEILTFLDQVWKNEQNWPKSKAIGLRLQ